MSWEQQQPEDPAGGFVRVMNALRPGENTELLARTLVVGTRVQGGLRCKAK